MLKHLLLLILLIVACPETKLSAQPTNTNISNTAFFEGEPFIAVNPTNHRNIVIAWMAIDFSTSFRTAIKTKASFDGGQTWGNQKIHPHYGSQYKSADVSMAFRYDGMLYMSYIDHKENPDSGGVYITHSTDGGINWTSGVKVFDISHDDPVKKPLDRPWLVVDNSSTSRRGALYITTKPPSWIPAPNRPYLKRSVDGGNTWSNYRYVDTTGFLVGNLIAQPMASPATTTDGALCIAYPSYMTSQSVYPKMLLAKSYNLGSSFQYHDLLVNGSSVPDTLSKKGYHLATNPNNAQQMAFAYLSYQNGDADVYITTTNDGGNTWSAPVRVNDDPVGNHRDQDLVWAAYDDNGHLAATWRDRRNASGAGYMQSSDIYAALSVNNGQSFLSNIRLSSVTAAYDTILAQDGNDFMSCALVHDTLFSVWGDTRTGNLNIFFATTYMPTGVSSVQQINDNANPVFLVSPNPASENITITQTSTNNTTFDIRIFDLNGKLISSNILPAGDKIALPIQDLPRGIYIVEATLDGELVQSQKLVKE